MRTVFLDACVPMKLRDHFSLTQVETARFRRWEHLQNGNLLAKVDSAGFDVFITADKNLSYQQNLSERKCAILVISGNNYPLVIANAQRIEEAALTLPKGGFLELKLVENQS